MSEPSAPRHDRVGDSLERAPEEILAAARPLDPYQGPIIEDLTEEEDRVFLSAIVDA